MKTARAVAAIAGIAAGLLGPGCGATGEATGQGTETRVLVVANAEADGSVALAREYMRARQVAPSHLVTLHCPDREEISHTAFQRQILAPLVRWWGACPDSARPDFVVLAKGVPFKLLGTGAGDDHGCVDSELCFLPRDAAGESHEWRGRVANPYYALRLGQGFAPFDYGSMGICLVTRLDGYRFDDARALIARGLATDSTSATPDQRSGSGALPGRFVLDLRDGPDDLGQRSLRSAAAKLSETPELARVQLDTTATYVTAGEDLLGYASWGSNDSSYSRELHFTWRAGALVTTFVSTSARSFREPPTNWQPGRQADAAAHFEGSPQSLIADFVRAGATGAAGNVYEPQLDGCVRPHVLFPAWVEGRNLAEAFYLATPWLSWQGLVLGDPLARMPR